MSSEDNDAQMSEVQLNVGTVQGDTAESMSQMQIASVVAPEEGKEMNEIYKIRLESYREGDYAEFYREYFTTRELAMQQYEALCDDKQFLSYYKKPVVLLLYRGLVGYENIHWELAQKTTLYPVD